MTAAAVSWAEELDGGGALGFDGVEPHDVEKTRLGGTVSHEFRSGATSAVGEHALQQVIQNEKLADIDQLTHGVAYELNTSHGVIVSNRLTTAPPGNRNGADLREKVADGHGLVGNGGTVLRVRVDV